MNLMWRSRTYSQTAKRLKRQAFPHQSYPWAAQTDRLVQPKWYKLESRKTGRKNSVASGEVLIRFSVYDPIHTSATPQQTLQRFYGIVAMEPAEGDEDLDELARADTGDLDEVDEEEQDPSDEADDAKVAETAEKRKKRNRLARLKRKTKLKAYEFNGMSDVAGVLFLEIQRITDLPPERNSKTLSCSLM